MNEASASAVDRHRVRREFAQRRRREALDALGTGQECICQLAGHRDGVAVSGANLGLRFGEGLCEMVKAQAQRGGHLHSIDDAAAFRSNCLEMSSADVPTYDNIHIPPHLSICDSW